MYYSSYHFYFYEVRLGVCSMNSKYTSVVGSPRTHVKHAKVQEGLHLWTTRAGVAFSLFLFCFLFCGVLHTVCFGDKTKGTQIFICTNEKNCIMSQMSERERELSVFRCSTSLCFPHVQSHEQNRTPPQHKQIIRSTATRA